jgi:hypothetical protein
MHWGDGIEIAVREFIESTSLLCYSETLCQISVAAFLMGRPQSWSSIEHWNSFMTSLTYHKEVQLSQQLSQQSASRLFPEPEVVYLLARFLFEPSDHSAHCWPISPHVAMFVIGCVYIRKMVDAVRIHFQVNLGIHRKKL